MGGSSLCPEVLEGDVRPGPRLPRAARPRLHRSRAGAGPRGEGRPRADALHRGEQVGLHPRAEHLQGLLLRPREAGARCRRGAASRFVAITDPGLAASRRKRAADGFRHIFAGRRSRSAGATPPSPTSAWCRPRSWASTWSGCSTRPSACCTPARPACPPAENPGLVLGTILGVAAEQGHRQADARGLARRSTTSAPGWSSSSPSPPARKARASSPSTASALGPPEVYGDDRLFVYLRLEAAPRRRAGRGGGRARGGGPARSCASRWRRPTTWARSSCAGRSPPRSRASILGINPFNQPDVEASKVATRALTAEYEKTGQLPAGDARSSTEGGVKLFADARERGGPAQGRRSARSPAT